MLRKAFLALTLFVSRLFALPPNDAVVVFNEIHYNPGGVGEAAEFIEVQNVMVVDVDMSGWRISSGADFAFPNGTLIHGGGRIVVAKTPGMYPGAMGPFTGALSNSGDTLRLRDNNDRAMDELTYGDKGEWPIAPDGGGVTLSKTSAASNSARPQSWTASAQVGGTPGTENFPPPPPPVSSRPIARDATWKYTQTAPAATLPHAASGSRLSAVSKAAFGFMKGACADGLYVGLVDRARGRRTPNR